MTELIMTLIFGALISVLGVINMTGNISSLHSYHRHRVTEENKKPFGRLVGGGTLIIGISLIIFSVLSFVTKKTQLNFLTVIGAVILTAGIIVGLVMSLYAMIKYNKGIF